MKINAINNTSPIIGLSMIGQLELLWEMFDTYIPQEVYNEIVIESSENAMAEGYIKIYNNQYLAKMEINS